MTIILITNCTNRKKLRGRSPYALGSTAGASIEGRLREWVSWLEYSESPRTTAYDVYAGDHWHVIKDLERTGRSKGLDIKLYICSAGYGLIPADSPIVPYSATFSDGQTDSVWRLGDPWDVITSNRLWWNLLCNWDGPHPGRPRTLSRLIADHPGAAVVIAASKPYLQAVHADLIAAKKNMQTDRLVIVSAGTKILDGLEDELLPVDSSLQSLLGGSKVSINARIARKIISDLGESQLRADFLKSWITEWMNAIPKLRPPTRRYASDEEICGYIAGKLDCGNHSATMLLKSLRREGTACEQNRFKLLYQSVRECSDGYASSKTAHKTSALD